MMLDADIVAVSPSGVWRVFGQAGPLSKWNGNPSKNGTGFEQPLAVHQHWHIDVWYIDISGIFYYLCAGRRQEIHAERDRKLKEARRQRQIRGQRAA